MAVSETIRRLSRSSSARLMLPGLSPILLPNARPASVSRQSPKSSSAGNGIEDLESGGMLGRIVHPENRNAIENRRKICRNGADEGEVTRRRAAFGQERFPRNADENWELIILQLGKIAQGCKILRAAFAKADPGVENEMCARDACLLGKTERTVEKAAHIREDIDLRLDRRAIVHDDRHCPDSAMTAAIAGSLCRPQTSLITLAPCSIARRATAAFDVSTESGRSISAVSLPRTGSRRASSSSVEIGVWPGRVDSAPVSMMSAPASASSLA